MRAGALRVHVWLAAGVMPLLVRLLSLRALLRLLDPPRWLRPYAGLSDERIVAAVERRLRNPRNMRRRACLRKGLVLYHFLRLAARPAELRFAVYPRPDERGRMHGHCWVVLAGRCLMPPPDRPAAILCDNRVDAPPADV